MADAKQCRICLDGVDAEKELGRLIRPCLCKGSISYVHIKCLNRWRNTSSNGSNFFSCAQCKYNYRFARTRISGIAENPVVVGALSATLFVAGTILSSYITTYFISLTNTSSSYYSTSIFGFYYVSPYETISDLVRAALRILQDGDLSSLLDESIYTAEARIQSQPTADSMPVPRPSPGLLRRLITRFVIGLPLIGASSIIQMMFSLPFLGPVQWIARYRGNRRRNSNAKDISAIIIIVLLLVGSARALIKVYSLTQQVTKKMLLRAEDAILEVN